MSSAVLKMEFNPESIKQDLARLAEKSPEFALEVMVERAHLIVAVAQIYVRVDTGSLRDSGRVERGGKGEAWRRVRVRFGGYVTNPKTGKRVNYAQYVEKKYPFLKPALEEVFPTIAGMIEQRVVEGLSRA